MTAPSRDTDRPSAVTASDEVARWPSWVPAQIGSRLDGARLVGSAAALALVASYLLTWSLWQARTDPPNLLGVDGLRSISFAWPLTLAALAALGLPRVGSVAHAVLLALAIGGDQLRLQPEFVFLAIMLVAAAWPRGGLWVLRWCLVSLWLWAGLSKAFSAGWPTGGGDFIASSIGLPGARVAIALVVPVFEIGLAVLALWPRAWRVLVIAAPAFHIGTVLMLAAASSNSAVWPWNLAIAVSVPVVFRGGGSAQDRHLLYHRPWVVPVVLVLYPLGFYAGYIDAYLAHNLYSSNTATAEICESHDGRERCDPDALSTWASLNVPLPPEPRLFTDWFERTCHPGQTLRIEGVWTRFAEREVTRQACPS